MHYLKKLWQGEPTKSISIQSENILEFGEERLLRRIEKEEVKEALKNMQNNKSPGLDGWIVKFYKRNQEDLEEVIVDVMNEALHKRELRRDWNNTNICLIPKKDGEKGFKDYRPISVCNVIQRLMSKVMIARLRPLLPQVIDASQAGFVANRFIQDQVLLNHEIIHSSRKKKIKN